MDPAQQVPDAVALPTFVGVPVRAGQLAPDVELPDRSDEDLAQDAQRAPARFDPLYRRYVTRVYRFVLGQVGSIPDAEDVTARAFADVLAALPTYRPQLRFAPWLFAIVRRRIADHFRARPTLPLRADGPDGHDGCATDWADDVAARVDAASRLAAALGGLSSEERDLLGLRFAAGLSFAEIGALTDRSEAAAKTALYRVLRQLREDEAVGHE